MRSYVNAVLVATTLYAGSVSARPGESINIPRNPVYRGDFFLGASSDVRVYGPTLSASEILALDQAVSPPVAPPPAPARAMRAFDFYSKFGVNGNLDSGGSVANELTDMNYIGMKNIRSGLPNASASDANDWASALAQLTAAGVRQQIGVTAGAGIPFNLMSDWINALKTYIVTPYGANMVTGVSGPNETDLGQYFAYNGLSGVPAANAAQADLYAAMKADPALSSIPIDMWPLGNTYSTGTTGTVGDQTAHCDRANIHDYYAADNTHQARGDTGSIQLALQSYLRNARLVCNRQAFITTETGWYTPMMAGWKGSGSNEYVQARLLLNNLFDHAKLVDNKLVYIFTLRWGSLDFSDPGWGVIRDDGTPKPSATAIRNLMAIVNDAGTAAATFTPAAPLNYSLSGMPSASGNFVIQKSNGAFDIILWNETPIWDNSTATQLSIPTSTVTITLPRMMSGNVYDPLQGTGSIMALNDVSTVQVSLNDGPLIIEVK
jgi:hypothetical protein